MRTVLILLGLCLFIPSSTSAQTADTKDSIISLTFGDSTFAVPQGCKAVSPYQIMCDDYQMVWLYFPNEQVSAVLEGSLASMEKNLPNFTKEKTDLYILGAKREGYKIRFTKDGQPVYQLVGYGPLTKHSVIVQVVLYHEIRSNVDLPEFARKIMTLPE